MSPGKIFSRPWTGPLRGSLTRGPGLTGTSGQAAIPRRLCKKDSCGVPPWRKDIRNDNRYEFGILGVIV